MARYIQKHDDQYVIPYANDMPVNQTESLSLSNLNLLDDYTGSLTLRSSENVECRPEWLHSTANIPILFTHGLDNYDVDVGTPERQRLQEYTTWFDVDKEHPLHHSLRA